jgi:hypothetical protein
MVIVQSASVAPVSLPTLQVASSIYRIHAQWMMHNLSIHAEEDLARPTFVSQPPLQLIKKLFWCFI